MFGLLLLGVIMLIMSFSGNNDILLYGIYIYSGLTILALILASVIGIMSKPSSAKTMGIGFAGTAIVLGISYALADGSDYVNYKEVTESASKLSGMLLYAFYILALGAVASVIFSAVNKAIR